MNQQAAFSYVWPVCFWNGCFKIRIMPSIWLKPTLPFMHKIRLHYTALHKTKKQQQRNKIKLKKKHWWNSLKLHQCNLLLLQCKLVLLLLKLTLLILSTFRRMHQNSLFLTWKLWNFSSKVNSIAIPITQHQIV